MWWLRQGCGPAGIAVAVLQRAAVLMNWWRSAITPLEDGGVAAGIEVG
jgi:hypothetical protein